MQDTGHAIRMKSIKYNSLCYSLGNKHTYDVLLRSAPTIFKVSSSLSDDLPLIVTPAKNDTLPFAIIISGDGGWNNWDQSLANSLAQRGVGSVGLDAQKYFWSKKTPEETTVAIAKIIQQYSTLWKKQKFIFIGYSFGADILPFIVNRLPTDLKNKVELVTLISPDKNADFEIHISDMLNFGNSKDQYDVVEELNKVSKNKVICLFGEGEDLNTRIGFSKIPATIHVLKGDHHYNNNFIGIADLIMKYMNHH